MLMSFIEWDIRNSKNVSPPGTVTANSAIVVQINSARGRSGFNSNFSSEAFMSTTSAEISSLNSDVCHLEGTERSDIDWLQDRQAANDDQRSERSDRKMIFDLIHKLLSENKRRLKLKLMRDLAVDALICTQILQ